MQRALPWGPIAVLVLWTTICFSGSIPAAAQELPPKLKAVISTALKDVCSPVVRNGASFKEAVAAIDPMFEDISKPGADQAIHKFDELTWIAVSQSTERKEHCTLLTGTKRSLVRPVFRHTINTWGCRPRTISDVKNRRIMVKCPETRIKVEFFINDENDVITGFLFGLLPKDEPSESTEQDQQ